jgi:cytochrome c biogenesis protein CcmG/thiol:disulfide interchange protein DsbE
MAVKPLILLPVVISSILFGALGYQLLLNERNMREGISSDMLPSAREGQPAPAVVLTQLGEGAPFTDATLREGGVKLVNYWASWCAPCRLEHPILMEIAASGVPVYGINYKDDPAKALAFMAELGNPYAAIGADASGRTALDWGLYGVPETYVIDADGVIRLRFAGPITHEIFEKRILPAIEAAAD